MMERQVTFAKVLADELDAVIARRKELCHDESTYVERVVEPTDLTRKIIYTEERKQQRRAMEMGLVGLAFSGGGIRSATFCLGVLQALADRKLLKRFDYLSTVSGGGYIGAWLAGWIAREKNLDSVEQQLSPRRGKQAEAHRLFVTTSTEADNAAPPQVVVNEEPEPISHLRAYSRYLSPHAGFLSGDAWALLAIYLRNFLINQTVLLPTILSLVFACWAVRDVFTSGAFSLSWWLAVGAGVIVFWVGIFISRGRTNSQERQAELPRDSWTTSAAFAHWIIYFTAFICVLVGVAIPWPAHRYSLYATMLIPPGVMCGVVLLTYIVMLLCRRLMIDEQREWLSRFDGKLLMIAVSWLVLFALVFDGPCVLAQVFKINWATYSAVGAWLGIVIKGVMAGWSDRAASGRGRQEFIVKLAPPLFMAGLVTLVSYAAEHSDLYAWVEAGACMLNQFLNLPITPAQVGFLSCATIAAIAAWITNVNTFSLHSMYANRLTRCYLGASRKKRSWALRSRGTDSDNIWLDGLGGAPTAYRSEPNSHGATRARREDLFSGFDYGDDFSLLRLRTLFKPDDRDGDKTKDKRDEKTKNSPAGTSGLNYQGPLPIFNTAINLTSGTELALQDRKADSFVLTPLWCGSKSTGYNRVDVQGKSERWLESVSRAIFNRQYGISLGRAMAISGAAISPNMGYHTSRAVSCLLTIFNARLGWWLENPRGAEDWLAESPGFGGLIFSELFSKTDEKSNYVYLSDGGHFDNLGIYELVRRRCQYIVVCDAEADGELTFFGLSEVIRRCRTDFGIRIDIDVQALKRQVDGKFSPSHCAVGKIHYEDVDHDAPTGTLIYLKPTLTGDEPVDVLQYAASDSAFPHQSTLDQFFSESQFESYRALGYHIASEVLEHAGDHDDTSEPHGPQGPNSPPNDVERPSGDGPEPQSCDSTLCNRSKSEDVVKKNRALFESLYQRWQVLPASLEEKFRKSVEGFSHLHEQFRKDENLRELTRDLYPELDAELTRIGISLNAAVGTEAERQARSCAELHAVAQMLQVMENAWLDLRDNSRLYHPLNRGWMNVFRRWTNTNAFHRHWPTLRGEYSKEFVEFCERQLRLTIMDGKINIWPWDISEAEFVQLKRAKIIDGKVTKAQVDKCHIARLKKFIEEEKNGLASDFNWEWPENDDGSLKLGKMKPGFDLETRVGYASTPTEKTSSLIWLIGMSPAADSAHGTPPNQDNSGISQDAYCCGILLVHQAMTFVKKATKELETYTCIPNKYELFIWLRGPYRDLGIGQQTLKETMPIIERQFQQLADTKNTDVVLQVRYPARGITGNHDQAERDLWRSFFLKFNFRDTRRLEPGNEIVMERRFKPA